MPDSSTSPSSSSLTSLVIFPHFLAEYAIDILDRLRYLSLLSSPVRRTRYQHEHANPDQPDFLSRQ